jgi:hypothetical protein
MFGQVRVQKTTNKGSEEGTGIRDELTPPGSPPMVLTLVYEVSICLTCSLYIKVTYIMSRHMHAPIILLRHAQHVLLKGINRVCFLDQRICVVCVQHGARITVHVAAQTTGIGAITVGTGIGRYVRQDLANGAEGDGHTNAIRQLLDGIRAEALEL